jgi:hypothetical protein
MSALSIRTGDVEQVPVVDERCHAQFGKAVLGLPHHLSGTAQSQVLLGKNETVGRRHDRLHPRTAFGVFGSAKSRTEPAYSDPGQHGLASWWSWASPNRSASSMSITVALGTSTPTSMTVVATRTSTSTVPESLHDTEPLAESSCRSAARPSDR